MTRKVSVLDHRPMSMPVADIPPSASLPLTATVSLRVGLDCGTQIRSRLTAKVKGRQLALWPSLRLPQAGSEVVGKAHVVVRCARRLRGCRTPPGRPPSKHSPHWPTQRPAEVHRGPRRRPLSPMSKRATRRGCWTFVSPLVGGEHLVARGDRVAVHHNRSRPQPRGSRGSASSHRPRRSPCSNARCPWCCPQQR